MTTELKKLVLFDIDGTLISAGGAGTRSMNRAFHSLFSIRDAFRDISMAGKTDIQIIKEGLTYHRLASKNGNVSHMEKMYLEVLREEIDNPLRQLKPGIRETLDALQDSGCTLGLLTGNLETGARIKLGSVGLNEYFLEGAYGSDHEDRDKLLPIAMNKFTQRGLFFTTGDCIVIGDTPRDVRCAKIHGAHCIAVATGPYSREDLSRTDADVIFDSLADIKACINFIRSC